MNILAPKLSGIIEPMTKSMEQKGTTMKVTIKFASEIEYRAIIMASVRMIDRLHLSEMLFGEDLNESQIQNALAESGMCMTGFSNSRQFYNEKDLGIKVFMNGLTCNYTIDPIVMVKFMTMYADVAEKIVPIMPKAIEAIKAFVAENEGDLEKIASDIEDYMMNMVDELGIELRQDRAERKAAKLAE